MCQGVEEDYDCTLFGDIGAYGLEKNSDYRFGAKIKQHLSDSDGKIVNIGKAITEVSDEYHQRYQIYRYTDEYNAQRYSNTKPLNGI